MIKLSTTVPFPNFEKPIDYQSSLVFLGSCFAENISEKMRYYGFQECTNPFGIIFNPVSIAKLLEKSIQENFCFDDVEDQFSYYAHSTISGANKEEVTERIVQLGIEMVANLKKGSHLLITLGTGWVYEHIARKEIVANCHKQPAGTFDKKLLSIAQIKEALDRIHSLVTQVNKDIKIIYTLSPVRHIKDGFTENLRSKSRLLEAILHHTETTNSSYLPIYEYVMDELRDYRFFNRDLVHLNDLGIDMVWERFKNAAISKDCHTTMKAVQNFHKLANHRAKDSLKHQQMVNHKKRELLEQFPYIHI
jgi:hypothetical protein